VDRPIFFDASGRRNLWSKRIVAALLVLAIAAAIGFAWSVVSVPAGRALYPQGEHGGERPLAERLTRIGHNVGWLPKGRRTGTATKPVSVGFYVPWDRQSLASLKTNMAALDWVVPSVATVTQGGARRIYAPDAGFP
jgi:peptidoglycan-N-acetylglucosamine deacetylase